MRNGLCVAFAFLFGLLTGDAWAQIPETDSGGPLMAEQAAFDVTHYALDLSVDPGAQTIDGTLTATAVAVQRLDTLVLNLDRRLTVDAVRLVDTSGATASAQTLSSERRADSNQVWIGLPSVRQPGDTVRVAVDYGGMPRVAPQPPWDGGFTWATTPEGQPWIATSCQKNGADLWWPVKDHPSDEPDSMDLAFTVPDPLVAASNGAFRGTDVPRDGWTTYRWHVSTPINPYSVALHAAPYRRVDTTYASTSGVDVPVTFYALPGDTTKARTALPQFLEHVRFLEEALGPYPFRADKYGIAQSPFLGMEHQTIIAYGNRFRTDRGLGYRAGFDALHFHELAHEWYGNCVTAHDWKDFWLHEGTATYLEALYAESLRGETGYREVIRHFRRRTTGRGALAYVTPTSAQTAYSSDVYFRSALVLHTLRYVVGDDAVRTILRRFAYPSDTLRQITDGRQCRQVSTADFVQLAEDVTGRQLDGFFMAYLYRERLPRLTVDRERRTLRLAWEDVGDVPFDVPVPVRVNDTVRRVTMDGGRATITVPRSADVTVDPDGWLLRQ